LAVSLIMDSGQFRRSRIKTLWDIWYLFVQGTASERSMLLGFVCKPCLCSLTHCYVGNPLGPLGKGSTIAKFCRRCLERATFNPRRIIFLWLLWRGYLCRFESPWFSSQSSDSRHPTSLSLQIIKMQRHHYMLPPEGQLIVLNHIVGIATHIGLLSARRVKQRLERAASQCWQDPQS